MRQRWFPSHLLISESPSESAVLSNQLTRRFPEIRGNPAVLAGLRPQSHSTPSRVNPRSRNPPLPLTSSMLIPPPRQQSTASRGPTWRQPHPHEPRAPKGEGRRPPCRL